MAHPKGVLIERMQKQGKQPVFETQASGPDHEPTFTAEVVVDGDVLGTGTGGNKKDAEKRAAEEALKALDRRRKSGRRGSGGDQGAPEATEAPEVDPASDAYLDPPIASAPFEGPWPVFERVLAASLEIANARVDGRKRGGDAAAEVRDLALKLYKETLEDLGEIVEVGDEHEG